MTKMRQSIAHNKLAVARMQIQNLKEQREQGIRRLNSFSDREIAEQIMRDIIKEHPDQNKRKRFVKGDFK